MRDYMEALELDGSSTSHPIQAEVLDPAEISSIFDSISYVKGASVIRMLHSYLGDEKFRDGLSHYLKRNLMGNAETKDLWASLSEKSGEKVDVIMPTFTEQMGYPNITVKGITPDGNGNKVLTLSYQKFWADASANKKTKPYRWMIPITVRKQSNPSGVALKTLVNEEPGVEFKLTVEAKNEEWVKVCKKSEI